MEEQVKQDWERATGKTQEGSGECPESQEKKLFQEGISLYVSYASIKKKFQILLIVQVKERLRSDLWV